MGWNLPDGCNDEDIDRAMGVYDCCGDGCLCDNTCECDENECGCSCVEERDD